MFIYTGFLELLMVAIGKRERLSYSPTPTEWDELFRMSKNQAIAAVMFKGVEHLPKEQIPPKPILLQWFALYQQIRKRNEEINAAAVAVTQRFDIKGLKSCILKGQANALLYPDPYSRTPGDIDIWIDSGHKRLLAMANEIGVSGEACYHHVDGGKYNDIPIEIHYKPSFMFFPLHNSRLQRWFVENAEEQYSNRVSLPDTNGEVSVPTQKFNIIFQLSHLYKHFLQEGVGLRQFMDYYYLLSGIDVMPEITYTLRHLGMYNFARGVMWVLIEIFGLDNNKTIAAPDIRRGRIILDEIMAGGNFGKFDKRFMSGTQTTPIKHNLARLYRDVRLVALFPSECICEPLFRLWHWWWRKKVNKIRV